MEPVEDGLEYKLLDKLKKYNNNTFETKIDLSLVNLALVYLKEYHKGQTRHSGEPFYIHPLEVAFIVTDYYCDTETIITALLHDTIEDTKFSIHQIRLLFGSNVASLVDQLTKLDNTIKLKIKLSKEENSYKLVNLNRKDKKVLLVKLIDRLHNMRTIKHIKSIEKRKRIALETLQTFIPLARYLGIPQIERELHNKVLEEFNDL